MGVKKKKTQIQEKEERGRGRRNFCTYDDWEGTRDGVRVQQEPQRRTQPVLRV